MLKYVCALSAAAVLACHPEDTITRTNLSAQMDVPNVNSIRADAQGGTHNTNADCGDQICGFGENCSTCPLDCGDCSWCGNGVCENGENCQLCPHDCGQCNGENVDNKVGDDEAIEGCGDGVCAPTESTATCFADCGSWCGDDACNGNETAALCPLDCGCGDGECTPGAESCITCPQDCTCYPDTKAIYRYYWYDDSGGQLNNADHMIRTVKNAGGYHYNGNHYACQGKAFELFVSDNGPDLVPLYQAYKESPNHLPTTSISQNSLNLGYTDHTIIGYCSSKQTPQTPNQLSRVYANPLIDHFPTTNPADEVAAGQGYYVQGGNLCWVP